MSMPPPVIHGGSLHGAVEALEEKVKKAQWESSPGLAGGCGTESQARQMGQMTASRVAMQHLQQE